MNYKEFLAYREGLSDQLIRLDDLNPYPLAAHFNEMEDKVISLFSDHDCFVLRSSGVRCLLKELFEYFSSRSYRLHIPADVYPEYFNLIPSQCDTAQYSSFRNQSFRFDGADLSVALVTNPVIPEGRYLTEPELSQLDHWLSENQNRWIIFDNVYDYKLSTLENSFKSRNVIFLNSLTKIGLTPRSVGWAVCKKQLPKFVAADEVLVNPEKCFAIQNYYARAWDAIDSEHKLGHQFNWKPPEVGYLSAISMNFEELRQVYGIATIPASIFGITSRNVSIVSCLSEVKNELL